MRAAEIPISSAASYQIKRQTMNRGGLISLLGTALMAVGAQGQDDSFCACSASSYTFTLNFTQTCPPIMVMSDGGVTSQICDIGGFGDTNTTDFVPVRSGCSCVRFSFAHSSLCYTGRSKLDSSRRGWS